MIPLLCTQCGLPLAGGDEAVLFTCPSCGLVHEVGDKCLTPLATSTAAVTTELAVPIAVRYVAVWRLLPGGLGEGDSVWDVVRRAAAPQPAYLYVPAFSLARAVVQQLGVRLTEVQPALQLTPGAPIARELRPALFDASSAVTPLPTAGGPGAATGPAPAGVPGVAGITPAEGSVGPGDPGSDAVPPILVGRREAWGLAYFIYMAIEARESHELRPADIRLEPGRQELLFLPAVWDPRYIHESNWRLLLREFDGLVA